MQVRHVFAGTAARTMAQAIIHPIDTVKTRLQVPSDQLCVVSVPSVLLLQFLLHHCSVLSVAVHKTRTFSTQNNRVARALYHPKVILLPCDTTVPS